MKVLDYSKKLGEFYSEANIGGSSHDVNKSFSCQFKDSCHAGINGLIQLGADAHVGSEYGNPYRIVVLSLDRGEGSANLSERRSEIEGKEDPNPHMKGTLETLQAVLNPGINSKDTSVYRQFALLNAAKCTPAKSMNMAPAQFFEHCAPHILKELQILAPQLIITQGVQAKTTLDRHKRGNKGALRPLNDAEFENLELIMGELVGEPLLNTYLKGFLETIRSKLLFRYELNGEDIYALCPTHPSERFGRWKMFKDTYLPIVGWICDALVRREFKIPHPMQG